ncbi:nucleoside triphosphate pyrophosphohydrolase [Chitinivibrio alkaliphilus]|uniref:Nucleoside triphosphate pyrophosphohydrolase n=1 Tax=Chitinivibrio alkaliphilus ACht1 TaxID=1313304 RepID=U7D7S5_9BACT|nr:nucleoside triphosphate pyrophosphohydrolase [Chitinivibrio alkaliphilus]ERP31626.1 nucleoside triphosphate pyrophosphohydrolase [Chitinivibrio alkaliphilus ACht1]
MADQIRRLEEIIARLRGPEGCPWDQKQTPHSIKGHLIEEAYEYLDALDHNDVEEMQEELGDILLQIVFHCHMAAEKNQFSLDEVGKTICEKLIRRHPHVFGETRADSAEEVLANWEKIKAGETGKERRTSILDGVPTALPSLMKAEKLQKKASRAGFDWKSLSPVLNKVEEEFGEFREAVETGNHRHAEKELGDILFSLVNVARHVDISAEEGLQASIRSFTQRFMAIEKELAQHGKEFHTTSAQELNDIWDHIKKSESPPTG